MITLSSPVGAAVTTATKATVTRIRTAMNNAVISNPRTKAPLLVAPIWTALTAYSYENIVRGAAAGSTNNLYISVGSNTATDGDGISAASGGPTGVLATVQFDGTVAWMYIGKATAQNTYPLVSTVVPTTSTDVMNGFWARVNIGNIVAIMGQSLTVQTVTAPLVKFDYGSMSNAITYIPRNGGTLAVPFRHSSSLSCRATFITNANKWLAMAPNGPMYSSSAFEIIVNGQRVCDAMVKNSVFDAQGVFLFDLSIFPSGPKTIEMNFRDDPTSYYVYSMAVGIQDYIYPLIMPNMYKIALEGDSIMSGSAKGAIRMTLNDVLLGYFLGGPNVYNNAQGGTGLISNNGGTKTTYIERLPDIIAFAPDILVVGGAHNDNSFTITQRVAANTAYFKAIRAALPECTIVVMGGNLLGAEPTSAQIQTETDLKTSFNTLNDANSLFIPIFTALPPLLPATADTSLFFQHSSPAPYTDGHPTGWYNMHMMSILANGIREFFNICTSFSPR